MPSKPGFQSVVDLGLREVGVKNDPRRLAAHFGKLSIPLLALAVLFVFAICAVLRRTGADGWIVAAFALGWTAGVFALALRAVKRSPITVVKVTAEGANQATWLLIAPFVLLALAGVLLMNALVIPPVILGLIVAVAAWRGRGRVPELLRRLRAVIAPEETVVGDGVGVVQGAGGRHHAVRLVAATDRRVLVAASTEPLLVVDAPYARVTRFGFEWKYWGRVGELSLTVAGDDGAPPETHVITSLAPANLLSIARALQANGVEPDDPAALREAERAWEEALRQGSARDRGLDRAAMNTREFDRGLWLLLGLGAAIFYLNPFGVGLGASHEAIPALLGVPVLCAVCGYVSGTTSSLAYLAPLNLLVSPAAGAGGARGRPARGSLSYALSGLGLIRLSGMLLAAMAALVATAGAAGFELPSLRLAVDEVALRQVPVDGRSNLTGNAASLTYTPGPGLRELITDEPSLAGPNDGARWELRSSFTKGYNVLTLGHYIVEPRLDDAAAIAEFIADKDRDHSRLAGFPVAHTERVVDGRKGYVWNHSSRRGYWYSAVWFPQPVHSVRVECVAKRQTRRFRRLCAEAIRSLEFH